MLKNKVVSIDEILDSLPHGSGINSKWAYRKDTRNKYHFYNTFDYMDENVFYDTYIDVEVVLYTNGVKVIFHPSTPHQKYIIYNKDITFKDYLQEMFSMWFYDNTPIIKIIDEREAGILYI